MGDALDMMFGLVLEDGRRWGEVAADFQVEDATAIFSEDGPRLHYLTRGRGGSKSTDIAGVALSWLSAEARPRSRGYVVAANADQAAEVVDAAASFVYRTPELDGVVTCEAERLVGPGDAWVKVLPASESGTWGKRDTHLLVCDEFGQWPETRGAKRVWTAVRTTVQKTPGCRLVILTSAPEPSHWSYAKVFKDAVADPKNWRVHEVPGPVPWQSKEEIEALRRELLPSEFDRLVLNIPSESEDRAITREDYEAAADDAFHHGTAPAGVKGGGARLRGPRDGCRYVLTVDVGTRNDATVICVAHAEKDDTSSQIVVDHLERWQGSKRHHVQIDQVRDRVLDLAVEYHRAQVYADPDQFVGSVQSLRRRGVMANEWSFTATSVGQVATALVQTFRNRVISVPDTDDLRDELLTVRLRESAPGVTRLDHEKGRHDDQAVAIGMACHLLTSRSGFSSARQFIETTKKADEIVQERRSTNVMARHWRAQDARRGRKRTPTRRCDHRYRDGVCLMGCGEPEDL